MKTFRSVLVIGAVLFASLNLLHAQLSVQSVQSTGATSDSIVQLTADAQGLTLVPPEDLPPCGTFWMMTPDGLMAPLPCPPQDTSLPVYAITPNGQFLVDGTGGQVAATPSSSGMQATSATVESALTSQATTLVNLITQEQTADSNQQMQADDLTPPGGDGGTNSDSTNSYTYTPPDYGTNLWIAQWSMASGNVTGVASNTLTGVAYEIMTNASLTTTNWVSTGQFIYGSDITNWTALPTMPASSTISNLFFRLRSWVSSDGSGLPNWWELQYFGTTGIDGNAQDAADDGWTIYQKFEMGLNPNAFYTPAAPQGLTAIYNADDTATVNWQPSPGPITGYTIQRDYYGNFGGSSDQTQTFNVSANTASLHDNTTFNQPENLTEAGQTVSVSYKMQAHYASGDSPWSGTVWIEPNSPNIFLQPDSLAVSMLSLAAGPQGSAYLVTRNLPVGTTALRVTRVDTFTGTDATSWDMPHSASTNGLYLIPAEAESGPLNADGVAEYVWFGQPVNTNGQGTAEAVQLVWSGGFSLSGGSWMVPPYFDGRAQLKQNLLFLLRSATGDSPFVVNIPANGGGYEIITNPANYAYSGFFHLDEANASTMFDPFLPFEDNFFYRNYVFSLADVDTSGNMTTWLNGSPAYQFPTPATNETAIPSLLATNDTRWLAYSTDINEMGVSQSFDQGYNNLFYTMTNGVRNLFGLTNLSAEIVWGDTSDATVNLSAGGTVEDVDGTFYPETAQPQFQTVGYDFWRIGRYGDETYADMDALPGDSSFEPTNTSRLMLTSVGSAIDLAGYAKLAVQNGYSGVYGYLGQYFDTAYKIDTNGITTTNITGMLSPYGQFFATEPGPVALVTMPDVDTGERGTCTVYCVSLQLDKNHDGNMDLSFNGPDATSQASPMICWINNGYTQPGSGGGLDKDLPLPLNNLNNANFAQNRITCQRDLENFFRLWICGVPTLSVSQNYSYTLSMTQIVGNPAVNVYWSCETNGGIGYLTDTNVAAQQANTASPYNFGISIGTVSGSKSCALDSIAFAFGGTQHLLFEGAAGGEGQLTFTIADSNSNVVAQTSVWLELHDITDFYERAVITNNMSGAKSNWISSVEVTQPAIASALGSDTNLIVLVHGINVRPLDCLLQGNTVFKRLYWADFQGKVATVKWPCNFLTPIPSPLSPAVFNDSELQGYKASTAFANYIAQLRSRFPDYRLNLLAHSQGNSVVSEAINNGLAFDTYILTQGALPDSAYDVNAQADTDLTSQEQGEYITPEWQPMGYHGIYTNFTGRIVNFYNPNDPVLDWWVTDQEHLKPTSYFDGSHYYYNGVNSYFYPEFTDPYVVTDPEESRADVSRSRTLPIGQSGPASAHGVIKSAVDLHASFGFDKAFPDDHSAQWTWPIQTTLPYYQQILLQIQPTP